MILPRRSQVLFNPGPVNLHPSIKDNLFNVELCHRQPEFADVKARVEDNLYRALGFSPDDHALALLPGGGSLAVDAALATFVRGRVLVLDNGIYARRLVGALETAGIGCTAVSSDIGSGLDLERACDVLEGGAHDWIAAVHHETSTGMLNPIGAVADLAARFGCRLYLDAVSSAGAHALDARADLVSFNSGKCLESLPGIAGVFFRRDLAGGAVAPALDAVRYSQGIPSTPNVQAFLALDIALDLLLQEDRPARYRRLAHAVWEMGGRKFPLYLPEIDRSNVLTAFHLDGRDPESLLARARDHGFVIYSGQEELNDQIFRVANMGPVIDEELIGSLFEVLAA